VGALRAYAGFFANAFLNTLDSASAECGFCSNSTPFLPCGAHDASLNQRKAEISL
jgi:hypothetical protein